MPRHIKYCLDYLHRRLHDIKHVRFCNLQSYQDMRRLKNLMYLALELDIKPNWVNGDQWAQLKSSFAEFKNITFTID